MKAAAPSRPRPRSPLAMAAFDYQEEVAERIREEGTMPDTEAAFEILANHRIREAMAAGEFDNLKGKVRKSFLLLPGSQRCRGPTARTTKHQRAG